MPELRKERVDFLGIDPGVNGGICVIRYGTIFSVEKMPPTERDIWDYFIGVGLGDVVASLEWIHPAIQGIGKSQMSKLYGNYKLLTGFLIAAKIPYEEVKAATWQKALGIPTRKPTENGTKWKNRLKAKAQQLFPKEHLTLNTCDACLIAEYGRRKYEGKL